MRRWYFVVTAIGLISSPAWAPALARTFNPPRMTEPEAFRAEPAVGSQQVTLAVSGMTCVTCPITVKKALTRVAGVVSAEVSLETATAVVTFDPTRTDISALASASTNAGFPAKPTEN